jgi:hypothetical protein
MSTITKNDYLKLTNQTKEITLPSGAIFKLKKVSMRKKLLEGKLPINNSTEIRLDKDLQSNDNSTPEQQKQQLLWGSQLIVDCVIEPKISLEPTEDCICIDDLTDEDMTKLLEEIVKLYNKGGQDLKSFRKK